MMKKLLAAAVCGAFAASALAAMPEKVTIVYVKSPFNLQNMVMKEKGMLEKAFEKDGVKVEWKSINSGAKQAQAMAAGAVDVSAVMNTASLLMANGSGNPVYVASGVSHPTDTFAIVGKPGASLSVKDLKGKKVAGPRGTVLHQLLIAALVKEGMSADDVEFLSMDIPAAMTAVTKVRPAFRRRPGLFSDCSGGFSRCPAVPSFRSPSRVMVMRPVPPSFFCRDSAWRRTPGPPNSSMRLSRRDSR